MRFQLRIAKGQEAGKELRFDKQPVVIGRVQECDVILYDAGVSRRHAQVFENKGSWFIEDLGSSNGTKVNGTRVQVQKLEAGDALTIGPVVMSFHPEPTTDTDAEVEATRIVAPEELR